MNAFEPMTVAIGQYQTTFQGRTQHLTPLRSTMSDQIRIAVLRRPDSEALLAMLGRCSPLTLYRRFHGITDGTFFARQVLAEVEDQNSYLAWNGDRCVGLGSLGRGPDTADIGVLVEDSWQRRGVGTKLSIALLRQAREWRVPLLRADVLAENAFTLRALARMGPTKTSLDCGSYTVLVHLGRKASTATVVAHAATKGL